MQVLVLYHSRTGNTKRLAEAVAEGVRAVAGCEALIRTPDRVKIEEFRDSHGVVVGSPVYFGGMAAELKKVLDDFLKVRRHMEGKVGAAFASSAHPTGGEGDDDPRDPPGDAHLRDDRDGGSARHGRTLRRRLRRGA